MNSGFPDGEELREIYRRGRTTLNRIEGHRGNHRLEAGPDDNIACHRRKFDKETDNDLFRDIVSVIFHAGMRAATVDKYMPRIYQHLGNYQKCLAYSDEDITGIKNDKSMLQRDDKIDAVIANAKLFESPPDGCGTFKDYMLQSKFSPWDDYKGCDALVDDLDIRIVRFGKTSARHFLLQYCFPLVKPDLHMMRIFHRLGLTETAHDEDGVVDAARRMGEAVGIPVCWVDDFVGLGMGGYHEEKPVCGETPDCSRCDIRGLSRCHIKERVVARICGYLNP